MKKQIKIVEWKEDRYSPDWWDYMKLLEKSKEEVILVRRK